MRFFHATLPRLWLQRGLATRLLLPLAWLYGAVWQCRALAYRCGWLASGHPGLPVMVVGNVVAGGAGKTPTTIALVQHLQARGLRVGVVSRGHGRQDPAPREVRHDCSPAQVGDEPLLIHQRTGAPTWVGSSRLQAARLLRQAHPEVQLLVCDDGLQHMALQRDLEICVMDERGTGNGWLLPAGPLREPWPRHVDVLLYTDGQARPGAHAAQRQLAAVAINGRGEQRALRDLATSPVDAVAGLARPEAFFAMLRQSGLTLADTHALADHDDFSTWQPSRTGRPLLCTEKDAVKLWTRQPEAWAVPLLLQAEPSFWHAIDDWLAQRKLCSPSLATDAPLSSAHGHETA